jgi:monothiol glutaredoxin
MNSNAIITIYVRAWCSWCEEAVAWLDDHGFEYEHIDIGLDPKAQAAMEKLSGQTRVPTLVIEGKVLADFDCEQLEKFLRDEGVLTE